MFYVYNNIAINYNMSGKGGAKTNEKKKTIKNVKIKQQQQNISFHLNSFDVITAFSMK